MHPAEGPRVHGARRVVLYVPHAYGGGGEDDEDRAQIDHVLVSSENLLPSALSPYDYGLILTPPTCTSGALMSAALCIGYIAIACGMLGIGHMARFA